MRLLKKFARNFLFISIKVLFIHISLKQIGSFNEKRQELETSNKELKEKLEHSKQIEKTLNDEKLKLNEQNTNLKTELDYQKKSLTSLNATLKDTNEKYESLRKEFE